MKKSPNKFLGKIAGKLKGAGQAKKLDKIKARRAKKEARKDRRAERIEARKGLAKGEGRKVMANRKQRLKEGLHNAALGMAGADTGYKEKTAKYGGIQEGHDSKMKERKSFAPFEQGAKDKMFGIATEAAKIKQQVGPKVSWGDFASGGGMKVGDDSPTDRTDMSSNASGLYRKKKGWNW